MATNPVNLVDAIGEVVPRLSRNRSAVLRFGAVTALPSGGLVTVAVSGGTIQVNYVASYVPTVGDWVALVNDGDKWLVMGEVASPTSTILAAVYPVGSIYLSAVATSPATLFGFGTWVQLQSRMLIGAGSTYAGGTTGGSATAALAAANLASHTHPISSDAHTHVVGVDHLGPSGGSTYWICHATGVPGADSTVITSSDSHTHTATATGSGTAFSVLNPYLAVYMWQRTA